MIETMFSFKEEDRKYRRLRYDELVPGMKCQKNFICEYDRHISCPPQYLENYYMSVEDQSWADYVLTEEDAKRMRQFVDNGSDLRNSPGLTTTLFRKSLTDDQS